MVDQLHYNGGGPDLWSGGCGVPVDVKPRPTTTQNKPVLDRETFQQLLEAAYVLQGHNDRSRPAMVRPDYTQALSELVEIQSLIQSHQLDLQSAASVIAARAEKFTGASGAAVGILKDDELNYKSATGSAADDSGMPVPAASSLSAHCFATGQSLQSLDALKDARIPADLCREAGVQSLIAVPAFHEGKAAGVLELRFSEKNAFQEQDVRTCQLLAGLLAEAIARSAELEWKQALAVERATMIEALERIKPQLERMAVEPAKNTEAASPSVAPATAPAKEQVAVLCRGCAHELELEEFYCGICGAPRPSEDPASGDLQSKWASLWHLKQAADIRKSAANEDLSEEIESVTPLFPAALESSNHGRADIRSPEEDAGLTIDQDPSHAVRILPALNEDSEIASTPVPSGSPWTSAAHARQWLESFNTPRKRVWLARHRANLYLATAATLLFAVIAGWGSYSTPASGSGISQARSRRNPPPPQLSLFEKTLVGLGLAVPPPSPTYRGNPEITVWEDVRTALYYCPGADLYGKTERGKFSTQREAQQDQFEPAFRRPCE